MWQALRYTASTSARYRSGSAGPFACGVKTINSLNSAGPRLYAADIPLVYTASPVTNIVLTWQTGSSDANAVTIVTPALGPSLGIAPAGTCT